MNYDTNISVGFAVTFFTIVISGFLLSISPALALIGLIFAFIMNGLLFLSAAFCAFFDVDSKGQSKDDQEIHP